MDERENQLRALTGKNYFINVLPYWRVHSLSMKTLLEFQFHTFISHFTANLLRDQKKNVMAKTHSKKVND